MTLLANGIDPAGMAREDAEDVAFMLLKTDRAVPPAKWVDAIREAAEDARNDAALAAILG